MNEVRNLRDLTAVEWRSGVAAWLGWMFDGLDMHLYTLVGTVFVAELLGPGFKSEDVTVAHHASWIQAAFLAGWALGGAFFGRVGDRLGRSATLSLTILTYAAFTGLSYFSQTWWQLLIFRFMAALGIGGEWAVGASLLSETWPKTWRPWLAAVLQTAVNVGVMIACVASYLLAALPHRTLFLVGVAPALLVLWIRYKVPETPEWHAAKRAAGDRAPGIGALFGPGALRISLLTILVCSFSLTAHWAFMFWFQAQYRNLLGQQGFDAAEQNRAAGIALAVVMVASVVGNFSAAVMAKLWGYRRSIGLLCLLYFVVMASTYACKRENQGEMLVWLAGCGLCQGVFALFTMYLPPLFPTLLRTTGAGFCYNIGRLFAAIGTVSFGGFASEGDFRLVLLYASVLFLPAAAIALLLPEPPDESTVAGMPAD